MSFYGNVKGQNAVRVFFSSLRGLYCTPRENCVGKECGGEGWGKPFKSPSDDYVPCSARPDESYDKGELVNPPYGTPETGLLSEPTDEVHVRLQRTGTDGANLKVKRGKEMPVPYEQFDWRGLESESGAGDFKMLHFLGPTSRYFPLFENDGFATNFCETTSNLYVNYFYNSSGDEVQGPGPEIRGGCIYDQFGSEPYYIVITGSDIQNPAGSGVQLWKRPVKDSDAPWETIGSPIADAKPANWTRYTLPGCPSPYGWDVPWNFNANGSKCIQYKVTRFDPGGAPSDFRGCYKYVIDFDLNTATLTEAEQRGENGFESFSKTETQSSFDNPPNPGNCDGSPGPPCDPDPCWYACSGNSGSSSSRIDETDEDDGVFVCAGDFEWPTDDVIELSIQFTRFEQFTYNQNKASSFTSQCCNQGGTTFTKCNSLNSDTTETKTYTKTYDWNVEIKITGGTGGSTWSKKRYEIDQTYISTQTSAENGCGPGTDLSGAICDPCDETSDTVWTGGTPADTAQRWGNVRYVYEVLGADLRYKTFMFTIFFQTGIDGYFLQLDDIAAGRLADPDNIFVIPGQAGGWVDGACPIDSPCDPVFQTDGVCIPVGGSPVGWVYKALDRTLVLMKPDGSILEEEAEGDYAPAGNIFGCARPGDPPAAIYSGIMPAPLPSEIPDPILECPPEDPDSCNNSFSNTIGVGYNSAQIPELLTHKNTNYPHLAMDRFGDLAWSYTWTRNPYDGWDAFTVGRNGGWIKVETVNDYEKQDFDTLDLADDDSAEFCELSADNGFQFPHPAPAHSYWPLVVM